MKTHKSIYEEITLFVSKIIYLILLADNYVSFWIASFDEKVKIWNKANLDLKFEYWKAMQLNYDILEKEDSKHSNSESSIVIRNLQNSESNSIDVRE